MNTGIFGEGFPYANFHDLNMDWIIKIAKDFLDQYTHIQETIDNGLTALEEKATNLEALLQAWYDTHSEDIANQLADALQDLNEWYNLHQNYLDQTLTDKIAEFNSRADAKAVETLETIPDDYTALSNSVRLLEKRVDNEIANSRAFENFTTDNNVIIFEKRKPVIAPTTGTWLSEIINIPNMQNVKKIYIHCGAYENGTSDRKLTALAKDVNGQTLGDGTYMPLNSTYVEYDLPEGTRSVDITLLLSRTTAITEGTIVYFNDLYITADANTIKYINKLQGYKYYTMYLDWKPGIYDRTTGQVTGNTYFHASIPVQPGDTFKVHAWSWLAIIPAIFVDSEDHWITSYPLLEDSERTLRDFEITAPDGAVKMYTNAILNYQDPGAGPWDMYEDIIYKKYMSCDVPNEIELVAIGDSWVEKNSTASSNFIDYLVRDGFTTQNLARGGTGYRRAQDEGYAFYQKALLIGNDIRNILIFGSFNDMGVPNYVLGDYDSTDLTTICGCINQTITNVYATNPNANLMLVTPGPWRWFNREETDRQKAEDYCNAIVAIAKKNHIPVLNFYDESNLKPWSQDFANTYYKEGFASNTTHPNDAGQYFFVYPKLRDFLLKNCI